MVRTKVPSGAAATQSKAVSKGKRKKGSEEAEVQSKKKRIDSSNYILRVLFALNVKAFNLFESKYDGKKVLKGRVFDFLGLGDYPGNLDLEISKWLKAQGWEDILNHQCPTYPRLVQVMLSNYSPTTQKTWIGRIEIDLSPQSIREVLGIIFEENEDEEEFIWPKKEEIFEELAGQKLNKPYIYLPANFLSMEQKVAHNVVYNIIYPRVGSTDQVPEKDARIIWALQRGRRLDLAQLMSDHLNFVKANPKVPLPYGMYFTKFLIKYNVKVDDEPSDHFKDSDIINKTTLKRMGYKFFGGRWTFMKARTKEFPPREEAEEEERREGQDERREEDRAIRDSLLDSVMRRVEAHLPEEAREPEQAASAAPPPPPSRPSRPTQPTSQPMPDLTALQNYFTTSLAKLESTFTNQIHTLSQRVDNLESNLTFKLDTLITLVESQQPIPPPDPFKAKMKGIVIHDKPQSSSTQSYHPIPRSPARPFPEPIPGPSTHQPDPSPSPQPVPQAHTSQEATPSLHPSQTTPHHTPQPSPHTSPHQPTPQHTQALSQTTLGSTTSSKSAHQQAKSPEPQPTPDPEREPTFDPNLALVIYAPPPEPAEEVGESQTPLPKANPTPSPSSSQTISDKPKTTQPIDIDSDTTPPAPLSSDSSDTPNIPTYEPLQTHPVPAPEPEPDRPILTIDLAEFQRRSLENRRAIDMNLRYIKAGVACREPYPYPELTDPNSHKYLRIISSSRYPTPLIDSALYPPTHESPSRPIPIKHKTALAKPLPPSTQPTPAPAIHPTPTQPIPIPPPQPEPTSTSFTLQRKSTTISPYPLSYIRRLPTALRPPQPSKPPSPPTES